MNIRFKNKVNTLSIKRINLILFFLMFLWIILYINLDYKDANSYFMMLNFFIFFIFLFFNYLYSKEFEENKKFIKIALKNKYISNNLMLKKSIYSENKENKNLFNSLILSKNILKKDYSDLEKTLFTFTSEYFLKQVSKKGIEKIELGTTIEKDIHVMFLDIIWFTTLSENLKPERALLLLNIYFDWIVEIIKKNNWFVDKFLWDWILVIFTEKQADNSIKTSIEIQHFIKKFRISEIWKKIFVWIWINSWKVIIWTIWSKERMEVTIIWDTVNTASRIEWLTRVFKEKIIISQNTFDLIENKKSLKINFLWEKILKWKKIKKKVYWVLI